jgi:hypothetical protein
MIEAEALVGVKSLNSNEQRRSRILGYRYKKGAWNMSKELFC